MDQSPNLILTSSALDTLVALVENGPLWDGDIPSKQGRDELIKLGFAVKIIAHSQEGYQAATQAGSEYYIKHFAGANLIDAKIKRKSDRTAHKSVHAD